MTIKGHRIFFAAIFLTGVLGASARAQHEHHEGRKTPAQVTEAGSQHQQHRAAGDTPAMTREPHQALAAAYQESLGAFARALKKQAEQAAPVSGDFARDAVAEMRRAFDQMARHGQQHMKTMGGGNQPRARADMQQAEVHAEGIRTSLDALERETAGNTIDSKRVANLTAELLKHLDGASGTHAGHQ